MRKILCVFATLVVISALSAQTAILFPGTFSKYVDPLLGETAPRKNTAIVPMETSLLDAYATFKDVEKPVLIGHSQGGSRALSYAAYLASEQKKTAEGVISLGGPVRGFTPLKGGKAVMTKRIAGVVDDLAEGVDATIYTGIRLFSSDAPFAMLNPGLEFLALIISGKKDSGLTTEDELFLMAVSGRVPANDEGSAFGISNQLIADLTPDSTYQNKYLTPKRVIEPGYYENVKDGGYYKYVWSHDKKFGWLGHVGYWKLVWKQNYKTVWREPKYADDPSELTAKIKPETRVAYIYGTNSSQRAFNDEYYKKVGDEKESGWTTVECICSVAGYASGAAGVLCSTYSVLDTGFAIASYASGNIPAGIVFTIKAAADVVRSTEAFAASGLFLNLNKTMNDRIYNTTASDGFVTVDSTSLPLSVTGGKSWTGRSKEDVESYFVTHQRLHYDERIWGVGGAMGKKIDGENQPIQDGGRIAELLRNGSEQIYLEIVKKRKQRKFE